MEHDDITVLLIYNGPGVTYDWKFSAAVAALESETKPQKRSRVQARGGGSGDDDDDDDDDDDASSRKGPRGDKRLA